MRVAWGRWALLAVVAGCGRFEFDPLGDATTACVGTACGVQCETTSCFPLRLYEDTLSPPDWGTAAAAMESGEVHLLYVDPRTNGVMWLYSDSTLRHWSVPFDLAADVVNRSFTSIALLRHADASLTALFMDVRAGGSTLYRRTLIRNASSVWMPEPIATVPLPVSAPFYLFTAASTLAGTADVLAFVSDGNDTTTNSVYVAVSENKLQTTHGVAQPSASWDLVATSVATQYFFEPRVALDTTNTPWLLVHARMGTDDDAQLFRYETSWMRALPGWGDPWHYALSIDPADNLHVFYQQEGTVMNPQSAEASSLAIISGSMSIGTWNWASLPNNAYLRNAPAREDSALRLVWEDPETRTLAARDTDGTSWSAIATDIVGEVVSSSTDEASALVVAPQMVNGTSHILWRDTAGPGSPYTLSYTPYTRCGGVNGVTCTADQQCQGATCVAR